MATKLSNNATTRLAASISSTATQISVTAGDGAKFPTVAAGDSFPVTLVKSDGQLEIVKCTARSGDLLTVVRAQEGTAPKAFNAGDRAELRMTEATLDAYTNERAAKAVQDGIATDTEATARTSKTKVLSPYGLSLNAQADVLDTSPGKFLTPGAFGVGATNLAASFPSASLDDLNVPSGIYYVPTTVEGRPENRAGIVWHRQAGSAGAQIFITSTGVFQRGRSSSAYGSWKQSLSVGDFGWGGQQAAPPNGRASFNPTGWYYSTAAVPFGGGQFFVDFQYGSNRGGMRISTDPYTDNFYFQGWKTAGETWRDACKLWHDKNFNPADYQPKGDYQPAGNYQPALGYTPVNKAGDTGLGSMQMVADGDINSSSWGGWLSAALNSKIATAGLPAVLANLPTGGVGTLGLMMADSPAGQTGPGATASGSNLRWSSAAGQDWGIPAGTWRCLGGSSGVFNQSTSVTLWQRIA